MAAHRYFRLYITQNWGAAGENGQIASMELRTAPGGSNLSVTGSGTASASSASNPASDAFDSNSASFWMTGLSLPQWLAWDFGSGVSHDITEITLLNQNVGSWSAGFVRNATLEYSDDGTNWFVWGYIVDRPQTASLSEAYTPLIPGSITAAFVAPSPIMVLLGGANAYPVAPLQVLRTFGGASAALIPPVAAVVSSGGVSVVLTSPSPTLLAIGHDSTGEWAADLTAPRPTLTVTTGANSANVGPKQTLVTSGTVTRLAAVELSAPAPTLLASGTVTMLGSAALTGPIQRLVGYSGAVATVSITGKATLTATGTTGSVGRATLTAPLFDLTASATRQNSGSAILTAPVGRLATTGAAWLVAPGAQLTAIGSATVAAAYEAYEAYAVNLNHRDPASNNQVTRYTNYPFDRIVRYKNSYFGMNSTGLYLLEGTTDNATPIAYDVKTHVTDFDATEQKTVVSAYMGGRMGAAETVTLFAGEKTSNAYPYTTPRGATPQNYRQKFGRGIKARYYGIGFKGDKEFDLDTLELEINKLPRRI